MRLEMHRDSFSGNLCLALNGQGVGRAALDNAKECPGRLNLEVEVLQGVPDPITVTSSI